MIGKRKRNSYKFTEKTHSKRGIAATVLAFVLLILYGAFLHLAFYGGGNLSAYYGSVGVLAMLVSLVGAALAIGSMREEDSFQLFPRLGLFLSLLSVACWVGTYAIGFLYVS